MARQILNKGTVANDGTGDSLRDAVSKINDNLQEIYIKLGGEPTGAYMMPDVSFDSTGIVFDDSAGANNVKLSTVSLTANRLINLPNASGTLLVDGPNQTLDNPILYGDLLDSNSNELLTFTSVVGAVNNLDISNSTAGVTVKTVGDATDVNLSLKTKGNGTISIDAGVTYGTVVNVGTTDSVDPHYPINIFNSGSPVASALGDGYNLGHQIKIININAGLVTVTPTNPLQGSGFTVPQYAYAEVIWTGTKWFLHADSDVTII